MAEVTVLPEPIGMAKHMTFEAEGIHVEKVPDEDDLVGRMNNLDPPVTPE